MYSNKNNKERFGSINKAADGSVEVVSATIGRYSNFAGLANPKRNIPAGKRTFTLVFDLNDEEDANRVDDLENKGYKLYTSQYDTSPKKYLDVNVRFDKFPPSLYYVKDGVRESIPEERVCDLDRGDIDAWVLEFKGSPCTRRDGSAGLTPYLSWLYAFTEPDPFEAAFGSGAPTGLGANLGPSDDGSLPFEL